MGPGEVFCDDGTLALVEQFQCGVLARVVESESIAVVLIGFAEPDVQFVTSVEVGVELDDVIIV